jgi:hypothetical protein
MSDRPDGSPTAVDVVSRAQWAAEEGTDKDFDGGDLNQATGVRVTTSYLVPVDKILYITHLSGDCHATAVANRELNQICAVTIYNVTDAVTMTYIGGNGGAVASYSKPITCQGGKIYDFSVINWSGHNCDLGVSAYGYEV